MLIYKHKLPKPARAWLKNLGNKDGLVTSTYFLGLCPKGYRAASKEVVVGSQGLFCLNNMGI